MADPRNTDPEDRDPRERDLGRRSDGAAVSPWLIVGSSLLLAVAVYHLLFEALDFSENLPFQYLLAAMVAASLAVFVRQNRHAFLHRS